MPIFQVNRALSVGALAFFLACAPSGASRQASESAATARAETASVATNAPAAQDPAVTKADLARIQGSEKAPLWVIIVSDFQCPYCKQWHDQTYPALRDQYVRTGKIRAAYVNFPLGQHAQAMPTAEAAMCAGAQGKFWEMHDAIFATQSKWAAAPAPAAIYDSLARATGIDLKEWRDCMTSGKMKPLIKADRDRASAAGARSTPSLLIGDRIFVGAAPIEDLRGAIDSALASISSTR